MRNLHHTWKLNFLSLLLAGLTLPCFALELSPRLWNHLPIDTNIVGIGYINVDTEIFTDPVIRLENVESKSQTLAAKYIRSFELFDKSARIDLTQSYQKGKWEGLLNGLPVSTTRSGWKDTFVRFAINLYGAPPLSGKEYFTYRSSVDVETIVGMALVTRLPTGEYMEDKLINLGKNRFTFRPQLGAIHRRGKWTAELTGEAAFHTDNDDFFNGNKLEQDPLYFIHAHLIHTFRPGLWLGAGVGFDHDGESTINGIGLDDEKQNLYWSFSFAYPINRYSGIKFSYIGSRTQESIGFDSDILAASFSLTW